MLTDLHIENVAVIQRAELRFGPGLNVLTGETGAGKSILIDALEAVLGGRTSRELVRTGAESCLITAVFDAAGTESWQAENGVEDEEGQLLLLRRITAEGKSLCRVNGAAVTAAQLRQLGTLLLDIHGQNDGRQLLDEKRHLEYLDRFGVPEAVRTAYAAAWDAFRETREEIRRLELDEAEKERLTQRLQETIEDLAKARLRPGEEAELSARRERLRNAGKLTEAMEGAYAALYAGEENALSLTEDAEGYLGRAAAWSGELAQAERDVAEAAALLRAAAETVRDLREEMQFSPEEYDALESRLAQLRKLEKRYGCTDDAALAELLEKSRARLEELSGAEETLAGLRRLLDRRAADARAAAAALTKERQRAGKELAAGIEAQLRELCMPSVRFQVDIAPLEGEWGFGPQGADTVCFLMSANAGERPGRISRIASGGELSRIMLAMKNVFAEKDGVPSLVFDEIDTGVSGIAAQRVGEALAQLSRHKQVLCVTHLPQLAALADQHFRIEKAERDGRAYTSVTPLDREGRRREIARLQGGDHITKATLQAAEDQLAAGEAYKNKERGSG